MYSNNQEHFLPAAETSLKRRKTAASAAVLSLLVSNTAIASPKPFSKPIVKFNLEEIYPNYEAEQQGLHLEGRNSYLPEGSDRAVLWFEPNGNYFKQHATDPADPNSGCQWDKLDWQSGPSGALEYVETYDGCGSEVKDFRYEPGIEFAPKHWQQGQKWSAKGISKTTFSINGTPACYGTNEWKSYVAGQVILPNGQPVLHTRTTEIQNWLPVPDAPASSLCPSGQSGKFKWLENFSFSKSMPIKASDGSIIGHLPGLAHSMGGNATNNPDSTHWDVRLTSWEAAKPVVPTASP